MSGRVVVFNNMVTPYTNRLYNELAGRGLDIAVLSCSEQEADRRWAGSFEGGYPHRIVPGLSIPLSRSRYTHVNIGIGRALDELGPNTLIVNGFYPSMLSAAAWARRNGRTLALTIDGWAETMPDTLYHRMARPWLLRRCSRVICCSQKGQNYFQGLGVADNRLALVPLVPAWDAPAETRGFAERSYDLLWCARINDDAKNASFFEEVAIGLKRLRPNLKVRVIGSGPAEARMLARLAAADINVRHDQYLPWQSIATAYLDCRLLLLPSLLEPWGLVCNEAMQCGTVCVVAPHVGAAGELVQDGDNGRVCPLDVALWIETVHGLLNHEDRWDVMSRRARSAMSERTLQQSADLFMQAVGNLRHAMPGGGPS